MRRYRSLGEVVVVALALMLLATLVQAQPENEKPKPRLLTVRGEAYVEAEPDMVRISLGIEAVRPKPKEAASEVAQKANAVKAKLAEVGVPKESVETSELYLGEYNEYDNKGRTIRRGYQAYHWLRVTLKNKDFDKLAAVIDGAVGAGATSFYGLSFEMESDTALRAEALGKAAANARQKAEAMAAGAKARIVGVQSIHEVSPEGGPYVAERAKLAPATPPAEAQPGLTAPPAEAPAGEPQVPGKLRLSCEVEIEFLLE